MFATFERSWKLLGECFSVLRKDKELLLFPVISGVLSIFLLGVFIIPFIIGEALFSGSLALYLLVFILYVGMAFIGSFFSAGLIAAADIRLRGGDPTFSDGIRIASSNVKRIFVWAVIVATVWLIISAARGRSGSFVNRIITSLLGAAWELATYFVLPVIIFEKKGVKDSAKRSFELFRRAWGETIVGNFSMGLFFGVPVIIMWVITILSLMSGSLALFAALLGFTILLTAVLMILSSAINNIYRAALYNYAAGRKIKFSNEFLKDAFRKK